MKLGDWTLWLVGIRRTARGLAVLSRAELRRELRKTQAQRDDLLAALEELEKWTEAYSVPSGVTIEEKQKTSIQSSMQQCFKRVPPSPMQRSPERSRDES